jgi:putative sigma-54 modulation protein
MRIDVVGRNLDVTDPIRAYAVSKVDKLNRFYDRIQLITVTVSKEDRHTHGAFGAEVRNADLYAAIDEAAQKVTRQLHEHKEKTKPGPHR